MNNEKGSLYIVSTPIGNLDDITIRAIEVLKSVDTCASEDTRVSRILFKHYGIETKLTSYHKFSEKSKTNSLIKTLECSKDTPLSWKLQIPASYLTPSIRNYFITLYFNKSSTDVSTRSNYVICIRCN